MCRHKSTPARKGSVFRGINKVSRVGVYGYKKSYFLLGKSDPIYGTYYGYPLFVSAGLYLKRKRRSSMSVRAPLPISAEMVLRSVLLFRNGRRVDPLY